MSRRMTWPIAIGVVAALATPSLAAPPKPITKSYDITAPVPYPTSQADLSHGCEEGPDGLTKHVESFTLPNTGVLVAELSDYVEDWDLVLLDAASGKFITESAGDSTVKKEKITWKKGKKGQTVRIVSCNWQGGPQAKGKYTFTPSK